MYQVILIIHVLAAVSLIGLVLVQQGKGAAMGAAFGSGASQTVFGSRGSGSSLLKLTIGFVMVFFGTSLFLNHLTVSAIKQQKQEVNLPFNLPAPNQETSTAPAVTPNNIPATVPADTQVTPQPVTKTK